MTQTTVELSVSATSEELALLSAAAQKRRLSLRDFLRLQVMAAAKAASKPEQNKPAAISDSGQGLAERLAASGLRPAFLP
jgi:hypothetical protein